MEDYTLKTSNGIEYSLKKFLEVSRGNNIYRVSIDAFVVGMLNDARDISGIVNSYGEILVPGELTKYGDIISNEKLIRLDTINECIPYGYHVVLQLKRAQAFLILPSAKEEVIFKKREELLI